MSLANLNDISTPVTIPTLQCSSVSYKYQSGVPPIPTVNQLGYVSSSGTIADGTPIEGENITQMAYSAANVAAGTYLLYYNTTLNDVEGDINSFPQIVDSATGLTVLAQGVPFYLAAGSQYSSTVGTFCFTATENFTAYVYWNTGDVGGTATPVNVGGLTLVRLA